MINIRARGEREDSSDLTSLIDVVFILLIFFILAASFAVHSIDFDLPPAKTSKALAGHVVEIRLNKDGSFLCDGIPTKKEELDEFINALYNVKTNVHPCPNCGMYIDTPSCPILPER